jgi:hypothetical protein
VIVLSLVDELIKPMKVFDETALREDFAKIMVALEISRERQPILILNFNMKNSYYKYAKIERDKVTRKRIYHPPEVHLGLAKLPFPRLISVHELIHATGVHGHRGAYASYTGGDKASHIIEKLIFGNRVFYDKRGNRVIVQ